MATKLNKNLTRETAVIKDGKSVYVTLTAFQDVEMRLRHERQSVKISIADLYDQLTGNQTSVNESSVVVSSAFIKQLRINAHIVDCDYNTLIALHEVLKRTFDDLNIPTTMLNQ